ncbi:uncharacterized protein DC041_0005702 [Schistosoma bovis]|uniref:Protein arginine N-methyltransferase domain-containing protein n=1 Tax=Schistosoma bovis TaxID=6184 RepID=A0A430Q7E7_SCHBO|nr:uncharacterized protein DC041_0005702 [Schistosoma bovis]
MLDSVLKMASKYLSRDGHIFPRHYTLNLLGVQCSEHLRKRRLEHWNDVYGYKMPALRRAALSEAHVLNLTNEHVTPPISPITILTQSFELVALDLDDMHRNRIYNLSNHCSLLCEQKFHLIIQPTTTTNNNNSDKISGIITIRRATTDNRGLEINLLIGETENSPEIKQTFDLIG